MLLSEAIELTKNFKFISSPSFLNLKEIRDYTFYKMDKFDDFDYVPEYADLKSFEYHGGKIYFAINISFIGTPKENLDYLSYAIGLPSSPATKVKYYYKILYTHPNYIFDDYLPSATLFILEQNGVSRYFFHNSEYSKEDFFTILSMHSCFSEVRSTIAYEALDKIIELKSDDGQDVVKLWNIKLSLYNNII